MREFNSFCFFDGHSNGDKSSFDYLAAFKKKKELLQSENPFSDLGEFIKENDDWVFGYLTYDLKNYIEKLSSQNLDYQSFPIIHFFVPEIIIKVDGDKVIVLYDSSYKKKEIILLFNQINSTSFSSTCYSSLEIKSRISKKDYIQKILSIKDHLKKGDIYEMNFCQEFYAKNVDVDPFFIFERLNSISSAPFSALYRLDDHFCMCASPERFLKKKGNRIISQPIKGTIKRSDNLKLDVQNKNLLLNSSKDFSENVMIVDLVRNDLSRIAKSKTVVVDELASLYTYQDVHHLISTISCELDPEKNIVDILKALFPMGSMTGAPKIKSMELIEKIETTMRGLYSGSIGYITPKRDFDFNVVIRSVLYNQQSQYLSFMVGGAITNDSDPESEYNECLLKAKSIFKVLSV